MTQYVIKDLHAEGKAKFEQKQQKDTLQMNQVGNSSRKRNLFVVVIKPQIS